VAGIGSDTGGSVRIPAAWNGLVGLKTTAGLVPLDGVTPLSPTLDTVGPLTRTVEDAALLHGILADCPTPDLAGADLGGRVFLVDDGIMLEAMPDDRRAAFEAAIDAIGRAGARIERTTAPEFGEALEAATREGALVNTEGYAVWRDRIEAAPHLMWDRILDRFRSGARFTADQGERARLAFARCAARFAARVAGADALLAPTTPTPPPAVERLLADEAYYVEQNLLALRNTRVGNLLRMASLTLPAGRDSSGLHCGLMLCAPAGSEARLLRLGRALETPLAAL
jgi:aspartyl-tRNA(Asn)/glutamyl-tRNA(Gln) amidotransferase subunit A